MIRKVYIDWDNDRLSILGLTARKGLSGCKVLTIATEGSPNPVMAEDQADQLKSFLKDFALPGARLVVALPRDRLIARQLTIPRVGPAEEPGLVRYQVMRDLNESPDEVKLDYVTADLPRSEDRRVLALLLRIELFKTWKTIASSAQLKLAGLNPRLAGLSGLMADLGPKGDTVALVALGGSWAELVVLRDGQPLFSRSLNPGTSLIPEIRRSLTLFGSQNPTVAPKSLFLLTPPNWAQEAELALATNLPLQRILPFDGVLDAPSIQAKCEDFTASLGVLAGLARLEEKGEKIAPDFLNPKQPPPPSQVGQQRLALYSLVGMLTLVLFGWYLWGEKNRVSDEVVGLISRRDDLKRELELNKIDTKRLQALGAWDDVVWLDEVYDISHRIPNTKDLLVTEISASPRRNPEKESDFRSHLTIKGSLPGGAEKREALKSLLDELRKDGVYKIEKEEQKGSDFTLEIDVRRRAPEDYIRKLDPPAKLVPPKIEKTVVPAEPADEEDPPRPSGTKESSEKESSSKEIQGKEGPTKAGPSKDSPTKDSSKEIPAKESSKDSPTKESAIETPAKESSKDTKGAKS